MFCVCCSSLRGLRSHRLLQHPLRLLQQSVTATPPAESYATWGHKRLLQEQQLVTPSRRAASFLWGPRPTPFSAAAATASCDAAAAAACDSDPNRSLLCSRCCGFLCGCCSSNMRGCCSSLWSRPRPLVAFEAAVAAASATAAATCVPDPDPQHHLGLMLQQPFYPYPDL